MKLATKITCQVPNTTQIIASNIQKRNAHTGRNKKKKRKKELKKNKQTLYTTQLTKSSEVIMPY